MAKVEGGRARIMASDAIESFRKKFGEKYEVYELPWYRGRNFMVRSTDTVGVSVDVKRGPRGPTFVFDGTMPSTAHNIISKGIFGLLLAVSMPTFGLLALILIPIYRAFLPIAAYKAMNEEITAFLDGED